MAKTIQCNAKLRIRKSQSDCLRNWFVVQSDLLSIDEIRRRLNHKQLCDVSLQNDIVLSLNLVKALYEPMFVCIQRCRDVAQIVIDLFSSRLDGQDSILGFDDLLFRKLTCYRL